MSLEPLDRDAARARLRSLAEQGLIDPAKLDDELAALDAGDTAALALAQQGYTAAGYREDDPLVISAGWSDQRRDGAPAGWAVNADRLHAGMGRIRIRVANQPAPGCPVLVLRGSLAMGNLKVRYGTRGQIRRSQRAVRGRAGAAPALNPAPGTWENRG